MFHALGRAQIKSIANIQLARLRGRLAAMEMRLEASDALLDHIAEAGFEPVYGARPLKRAIQGELENPLAKAILSGGFAAKDVILADWREGSEGGALRARPGVPHHRLG